MNTDRMPQSRALRGLLFITLLGLATPLAAEAMEKRFAEQTSDILREYLSDPRRVGALSGSVLAGALTAHPAGPVLGSLIGFMIGKQAMFDEDKVRAQRQQAEHARRDIIPASGQPVATLSFSQPQTITFQASGGTSALTTPVDVASLCSGNARTDPRLRNACFYYQAR